MTKSEFPARYAPQRPFPPYAFVPGQHPHPVTHPEGHSFGQREEPLPSPNPAELDQNFEFRFAVDLFNHGYYWEAHEAWEGLWQASGRQGSLADFFKALIHLAAVGVKAREGNINGVIKHAQRAQELFEGIRNFPLAGIAERLVFNSPTDSTPTTEGHPVLGIRLELEQLTVQ